MSNQPSRSALRLAISAICANTVLLPGMRAVSAQESSQAEETIVVTGSRIRRDEFTSSSPIQIITADSATMEGLIDTGDILQSASVASGSVQFNNRFGRYVIEGGTGIRPVSLRGLGAQRSLILLNGKRAGPAGVRGQVAGFDLNVIPESIVQRYEILKDGASSIYGSDAVAGVVNIITRTTIDGPEVTMDASIPTEGGGEAYSLSAAHGLNFDRGNIVMAAEFQQREAIRLGDRDFLSCQEDLIFDADGNRIDREDRGILGDSPNAQCFNLYANTFIDALFGDRYIEAPDGVTIGPVTGYRPRTNGSYTSGDAYYEDQLFFPRVQSEMIQNETQRGSFFISSDQEVDILGGISWRNEGLYNTRKTIAERWRQFFPLVGSANIPILPVIGLPPDYYAYPNDPTYENGFGDTLSRPVIPYPANSEVTVDYVSLATTLDGEFGANLPNWAWTLDVTYSHSGGEYKSDAILASESGDIFYDDDPPAFDYMDPQILRGNYGREFIDTIGTTTIGETTYEQYVVSGVMTGDLGTLPAGDVSLATGFEYRDYSIDDQPDAASQAGDLWNSSSALVTEGQDHVAEIFAEVEVPLVAGQPGVEELTLNLSARAFEYKSYGSDNVWKAGLNWQVIPALRFRATHGTSYRAPALYELFLGNQTGFQTQTAIDPCIDWGNNANDNIRANCAADGIPPNFNGGASGATIVSGGGFGVLESETSDASTFGVIITPAAGNLSIALDYFKIEVNDEVAQLGPGAILGGCYGAQNFPNGFCNLFTRDPGTNPASPDAFGIIQVNDSFINVNNQDTEGWDITLRYERDFDFGTLLTEMQGTYTLTDEIFLFDPSIASGFDTNDFNGTIGDPTFTADLRFAVVRNDWTFNYYMDFVNGMNNSVFADETFTYFGFNNARRIITTPSVRYHDVSVRWQGPAMTVIAGISNLTDEEPPIVSTGTSDRYGNVSSFATQYDLAGRTGFLSITREF